MFKVEVSSDVAGEMLGVSLGSLCQLLTIGMDRSQTRVSGGTTREVGGGRDPSPSQADLAGCVNRFGARGLEFRFAFASFYFAFLGSTLLVTLP